MEKQTDRPMEKQTTEEIILEYKKLHDKIEALEKDVSSMAILINKLAAVIAHVSQNAKTVNATIDFNDFLQGNLIDKINKGDSRGK